MGREDHGRRLKRFNVQTTSGHWSTDYCRTPRRYGSQYKQANYLCFAESADKWGVGVVKPFKAFVRHLPTQVHENMNTHTHTHTYLT